MNAAATTMTASRLMALGTLAAAGLALGACGGDDGSDDASSEPTTVSAVSACFDDLGQHPRKVDVSLVNVPPDLGVSSQQGSANVWVTDDPQAVIDQEEELSQLDSSEALIPVEDKLVQGANVIAVVDSNSSPDYRDTIAACVPPSG
jgi:hypothetical protein